MAQAILNEVKSAKDFFSQRMMSMPASSTETLAKNFAAALIQHINNCLSLSLAEATEISKALQDTPYDEEALKKIVAALDAKVLKNTEMSLLKSKLKDGHYLQNWWAYCTADEWQWLKDPKKSWVSKMTKIVERANLLGCTDPGEQSIKWMMAKLMAICATETTGSSSVS